LLHYLAEELYDELEQINGILLRLLEQTEKRRLYYIIKPLERLKI
jgi:hypothetical protein